MLEVIIFTVIVLLCVIYNPVIVLFILLLGAPLWLALYFILATFWHVITGE